MHAASTGVAARAVREVAVPDGLYVHPEWAVSYPWLAQGTTGSREGSADMGWFGTAPVGEIQRGWRSLRDACACRTSVHAKQVHGADVQWHTALPPGAVVVFETDGHATSTAGILLTVSVADCVPIFLLDENSRAIAVLHAGWRGAAAGMLEAGIAAMRAQTGAPPDLLRVHFGPAICGACYEVGPEVPEALGLGNPGGRTQLDVRNVLTARAIDAGVDVQNITCSAWCTRCGDSPFFSHRAGQPERQMAVAGLRA